jgi:hypothetical protein
MDDGSYEAVVTGLKPDTDIDIVAVATTGGVRFEGEGLSYSTGSAPAFLPSTTVWRDETIGAASGGFLITSLLPAGPPVILDDDGDYVWWCDPGLDDPFTISPVQPARDGTGLLYLLWTGQTLGGAYDETRKLIKVAWDGTTIGEIEAPDAHHDFTELPDGAIAMIVYDTQVIDGEPLHGDRLVERTFDGDEVEIWSIWDAVPYDPDLEVQNDETWGHSNAVRYDEIEDVYYLSSYNFSALFKIDRRTGETLWTLGSGQGGFTLTEGQQWFRHQHRMQPLDDGRLLLFDNQLGTEGNSRVVELDIDEAQRRVDIVWSAQSDPPLDVYSFGNPVRCDSGHTFVDWSTSGQIDEFDVDGDLLWRLNLPMGAAFGYASWTETLGAMP